MLISRNFSLFWKLRTFCIDMKWIFAFFFCSSQLQFFHRETLLQPPIKWPASGARRDWITSGTRASRLGRCGNATKRTRGPKLRSTRVCLLAQHQSLNLEKIKLCCDHRLNRLWSVRSLLQGSRVRSSCGRMESLPIQRSKLGVCAEKQISSQIDVSV